MLVNHLPATKVEGNELPPELYEHLTNLLQNLRVQNYSEIGFLPPENGLNQRQSCSVLDDVQVVEKLSDLDRKMLDLTRDLATHRFLTLNCEGPDKERPQIVILLALEGKPLIIRVNKVLQNYAESGSGEKGFDLIKKAMRPLLQLLFGGHIVVIGSEVDKDLRCLKRVFQL